MDNLELFNRFSKVPPEAIKPITGGRLKGMSDINPVWRIKALTEAFGPCGTGWRYEIADKAIYPCGAEIVATVDIWLWYKTENGWSEAIPGIGGSMLMAEEKNGVHANDEAFKMALTDAISVAAKALGVGADVYMGGEKTKYTAPAEVKLMAASCSRCGSSITEAEKGYSVKKFGQPLCRKCQSTPMTEVHDDSLPF